MIVNVDLLYVVMKLCILGYTIGLTQVGDQDCG